MDLSMRLRAFMVCPRCGRPVTMITRDVGRPAVYDPCGHEDLSADLKEKIDLDAVRARHDAATAVGMKFNTEELVTADLDRLFACCSDVPELLEEISRLRGKLGYQ